MDKQLFNTSIKINENFKRNIVYIAPPSEAFADLIDTDEDCELLRQIISSAKRVINKQTDLSDFYYTTAIDYPFKTEPFMQTRYSDGSYPVWYGSRNIHTTLCETIYHLKYYLQAIEDIDAEEKIVKKRTIYDVYCDGIFINLVGKELTQAKIISNDYTFTQAFGRSVKEGDYPGILSPSARDSKGENINVFKQNTLKTAELLMHLDYTVYTSQGYVEVSGLSDKVKIHW